MRDRRVIYDSEEEEQGLSPPNSPAKGEAPRMVMSAKDDHDGLRMGHGTGDSRSTDPEFFQRIYEDQQKATAVSDLNPKAQDNSSSITDPILKGAKKTAPLGNLAAKDSQDFTQITTPSTCQPKQKDVYAFSLSDEEGAPAMLRTTSTRSKTAGKRKRGRSAAPDPDLDPDRATVVSSPPRLSDPSQCTLGQEDDDSRRPTRKKRKSARDQCMRQIPEDVDLLVVPTPAVMSDDPPDETNVAHDGIDSVGSDKRGTQGADHGHSPASFFIEPPDVFTSSQKREYLRVSGYSELDRDDNQQQASPPVLKPAQSQGQRPISTNVSTIAYTTPSRYASSIAPLPILDSLDGRSSNWVASSGGLTQPEKTQPRSSPDELNARSTVRSSRGRKVMSVVDEEDELAHRPDSWSPDRLGYSRETYVPRPHRHRSGADRDSIRETQAEVDSSTSRNKRQGEGEREKAAQQDPWDSDKTGSPKLHHVPRPSRRRSRVTVEDDEEMQHPEQSMPDTCPPGDANYYGTTDGTGLLAMPVDQVAPDHATEAIEGVDPDFWAAMPNDIRQELISQQQSALISQASRTRRNGRAGEASNSLVPDQEETPQPKKRGRKKKERIQEGPEARPSPAPAPTITGKRKRGRPRKADVAPPPPPENEESAVAMEMPEQQDIPNTLPDEPLQHVVEAPEAPAKRDRKKAAHLIELEESARADQEDGESVGSMVKLAVEPLHSPVGTPVVSVRIEDCQALRDISNTASSVTIKSGSALNQTADMMATDEVGQQQQGATPEPTATGASKSASTPGQQGKVPLRVGLSKKSRIAPLLKVIRK